MGTITLVLALIVGTGVLRKILKSTGQHFEDGNHNPTWRMWVLTIVLPLVGMMLAHNKWTGIPSKKLAELIYSKASIPGYVDGSSDEGSKQGETPQKADPQKQAAPQGSGVLQGYYRDYAGRLLPIGYIVNQDGIIVPAGSVSQKEESKKDSTSQKKSEGSNDEKSDLLKEAARLMKDEFKNCSWFEGKSPSMGDLPEGWEWWCLVGKDEDVFLAEDVSPDAPSPVYAYVANLDDPEITSKARPLNRKK